MNIESRIVIFSSILILYSIFLIPKPAHAGLLLGAPKYAGLSSGLVGYWSFDGPDMAGNIAYDRGGTTTENGTLTNGPIRTEGKLGQALSFGGVDDYVDLANPAALQIAGSLSVSAWIKIEAFNTGTTDDDILSKSGNNGAQAYQFKGTEDCGPETIALLVSSDGFSIGQRCGATTLSKNVWYHVAGVYNTSSQTVDVYLNGFLDNGTFQGTAQSSVYNAPGVNAGIGKRIGSNSHKFTGKIDDVRVYNRALTADEIKRLYKIGATLKLGVSKSNDTLQNGLVGWWTFDAQDMAGNIAYDRGGTTTENGTLTNAPQRAAGKIGQALNFDGSDDYVTAGSGANMTNLNTLSLSAWIKPRTAKTFHTIISKNAYLPNSMNGGWILYTNSANAITFGAAFNAPNYDLSAGTANNLIKINQWQHVLVTWNGASSTPGVHFYLNGTDVGSTGQSANGDLHEDEGTGISLQIGIGTNTDYFDGLMDDVRVYNRVLAADEIKRLYRIGATLKMGVSKSNDTLQNGLVGWWTFDAPDMAGNIFYDKGGTTTENGTLVNTPQRAAGKIGQALSFDGVDDYATMGDINALDGQAQITASAWIKSASSGANATEAHIIDKSGCTGMAGSGPFDFGISFFGSGKAAFVVYPAGGLPSNYVSSGDTATTVNDGRWHFVVGSYDNKNVSIWVDGVKENSAALSSVFLTSTDSAVALSGLCGGSPQWPWKGMIDDVRVYNRALTTDEIKRLYNMGK